MDLSAKRREEAADALQKVLATTYALYLKSQNFHWNLRGPEFIALHLLFEKQYEELAEAVDEIAERIVSLGYPAEGGFAAFAKLSLIKDAKHKIAFKKMIEELLDGHETISKMMRPMIPELQELTDEASADLLIKRLGVHEKAAWMLRSHLKA